LSELNSPALLAPDDSAASDDLPEFAVWYRRYEQALRANQAVDFDDLLLLTVRLFESHPTVLAEYQARFRWIAVDEYQDSNLAQYRLLALLATPGVNLCVIGDPDQAIYGFRGADRAYFLRFQQDFPDARRLCLTQNYRSTRAIISAASQVIAKSAERRPFDLWTDVISAAGLDVYAAPTEKAEAEYVVHAVEKMVGGTTHFSLDSGRVESHDESPYAFGDFAVLYRLNAQAQALQDAFQRSGIPYQVVGQRALYDYADVREILAYLWLAYNPAAVFHLDAIHKARHEVFSVVQELELVLGIRPVTHLLERVRECIGSGGSRAQSETAAEQAEERFRRLSNHARPFEGDLVGFLESTALRKESDDYDPRADRVTLMTLHASKGLEFPVVFLTGCEESVIPYIRPGRRCDIEEERRLFYVGMTRAQRTLVLTRAQKRFLFGETLRNLPSRFLTDIDAALKEFQHRTFPKSQPPKDDAQLRLF
jgi:DNA helicase II / ATP-dependent DNA helicase PcrA